MTLALYDNRLAIKLFQKAKKFSEECSEEDAEICRKIGEKALK
jgi:hypothetical protein